MASGAFCRRNDGPWTAIFVDSDISKRRFRHFHGLVLLPIALGENFHGDGQGSIADFDDIGVTANDVADKYRFVEHKRIHGDRNNTTARDLMGKNTPGDVDLRHDPTAENITRGIGIRWHSQYARRGLAVSRKDAGRIAHINVRDKVFLRRCCNIQEFAHVATSTLA